MLSSTMDPAAPRAHWTSAALSPLAAAAASAARRLYDGGENAGRRTSFTTNVFSQRRPRALRREHGRLRRPGHRPVGRRARQARAEGRRRRRRLRAGEGAGRRRSPLVDGRADAQPRPALQLHGLLQARPGAPKRRRHVRRPHARLRHARVRGPLGHRLVRRPRQRRRPLRARGRGRLRLGRLRLGRLRRLPLQVRHRPHAVLRHAPGGGEAPTSTRSWTTTSTTRRTSAASSGAPTRSRAPSTPSPSFARASSSPRTRTRMPSPTSRPSAKRSSASRRQSFSAPSPAAHVFVGFASTVHLSGLRPGARRHRRPNSVIITVRRVRRRLVVHGVVVVVGHELRRPALSARRRPRPRGRRVRRGFGALRGRRRDGRGLGAQRDASEQRGDVRRCRRLRAVRRRRVRRRAVVLGEVVRGARAERPGLAKEVRDLVPLARRRRRVSVVEPLGEVADRGVAVGRRVAALEEGSAFFTYTLVLPHASALGAGLQRGRDFGGTMCEQVGVEVRESLCRVRAHRPPVKSASSPGQTVSGESWRKQK